MKQLTIIKSINKGATEGNDDYVETRWVTCKNVVHEVSREILGMEMTIEREMWLDEACKEANDAKNKAYELMIRKHNTRWSQEEYKTKKEEKHVHTAKRVCTKKGKLLN